MFGLFKKEEARSPTEKLTGFQEKKDWVGLAKAYYEMGAAAMDSGGLNHAQLWLHRADTVYSAMDEVYDAVGEAIVDDCSDRIGCLENVPMLLNSFQTMPTQEEYQHLMDVCNGLYVLDGKPAFWCSEIDVLGVCQNRPLLGNCRAENRSI